MDRPVPPELAACEVTDERGAKVRLGELWAERTVVLAFVRHFGCMFCREHVVQLYREMARIRAAGAELVVIGSGTPNFIAGFREVTGFSGPILSDPDLASYRAAGLRRSMWRNFTPAVVAYGVRALARGNMQGRTQGDAAQQGGVLVIVPPGRIIYQHISKAAGDNAAAAAVVGALETAPQPSAPSPSP